MRFLPTAKRFLTDRSGGHVVEYALIAGLIVIGITLDATGRYLFASPIQGMQAIVEGLLQPVVVFFAAGLAARAQFDCER